MSNAHRPNLMLALAVALIAPQAAMAKDVLEIRQTLNKGGVETDADFTRIRVTGRTDKRYDTVTTRQLDFWLSVSGKKPGKMAGNGPLRLKLAADNGVTTIDKPDYLEATRIYHLVTPYVDPRSATVSNTRVSPIKRCNDEIDQLRGAARDRFQREGGSLLQKQAYQLQGVATHELLPGGIGFKEPYKRDFPATAWANAQIICAPLAGPKVRTQTSTQGAADRPGQRREPVIPAPDRPARATPQAADFDIRIRRVDRGGPGGATRLWLYNAGPNLARGCTVTARAGSAASWQTVTTTDVAARQTLGIDALLPTGANLHFIVACIGEPESNLTNNTATLP